MECINHTVCLFFTASPDHSKSAFICRWYFCLRSQNIYSPPYPPPCFFPVSVSRFFFFPCHTHVYPWRWIIVWISLPATRWRSCAHWCVCLAEYCQRTANHFGFLCSSIILYWITILDISGILLCKLCKIQSLGLMSMYIKTYSTPSIHTIMHSCKPVGVVSFLI